LLKSQKLIRDKGLNRIFEWSKGLNEWDCKNIQ
jgi:hypothetical protein